MIDKVYQQNIEIASQQIKEILYLFNPVSLEIFELNETAAFVWNKLKNGSSIRKVISSLQEEYDVTLKQANIDVKNIISYFIRNGLVFLKNGKNTN